MDHQAAPAVRFPQIVEVDFAAGVVRLDGCVTRDVGRLIVSCGPAGLRVQITGRAGDAPARPAPGGQ